MHFASYYRWLVYQHLFGMPDSSTTILDIGGDDGGFVERIGARQSIVLDASAEALRTSRAGQPVCADGICMPFGKAQFDHVILSDVIEHVLDDQGLIRNAADCVKPGGVLWVSTTAINFSLFPPQITGRAERSWGHVRKGYTSERLLELVGNNFNCTLIQWPECMFRSCYVYIWACSKYAPQLACQLASLCFLVDRQLKCSQNERGHLYVQAVRWK